MNSMQTGVKITAAIIAYNEEDDIGRCLESLQGVADEIVVVDSYSTDRTREVCAAKDVRFLQHPFAGHIEQKNYAVACAGFDHILSLDADEALSDGLKQSILAAKQSWDYDGYAFNRLTNYCGKWIRHCGWYPDIKLRLWDRRKGYWGGVNPHDRVVMDHASRSGYLSGDLLHYSYPTIDHHVAQIHRFSTIAARAAFERGRRTNLLLDVCLNPALTFLKKYFLQLGVLDGYEGFAISIHTAYGKFLKYAKLRALEKSEQPQRL
jgi:glycosyltransferase involved in cell wall biosynthesis